MLVKILDFESWLSFPVRLLSKMSCIRSKHQYKQLMAWQIREHDSAHSLSLAQDFYFMVVDVWSSIQFKTYSISCLLSLAESIDIVLKNNFADNNEGCAAVVSEW